MAKFNLLIKQFSEWVHIVKQTKIYIRKSILKLSRVETSHIIFQNENSIIIITINHSLDLPLRFWTGGPRWPYSRLKSIPSTENGSDANKTPNKVNQIIFDIFSLVLYTFLANSIVCCKYIYISVALYIETRRNSESIQTENFIYENETTNTPSLFRCLDGRPYTIW